LKRFKIGGNMFGIELHKIEEEKSGTNGLRQEFARSRGIPFLILNEAFIWLEGLS